VSQETCVCLGEDTLAVLLAGSEQKWERRKAELMAGGRWVKLLY